MLNPRIERIAYIGWRGIEGCEIIDLDQGPLTGFIGPSGAGKSTLVICLDYALLPDRKMLNIRPISEVQDSKKVGTDSLVERIDARYGYAYVALDITTRTNSRLIAGIYVEPQNGHAEFTRWLIKNPQDALLRELLGQTEEGEEFFPPFAEFKRNCAVRGIDVTTCTSVGQYGQALYEAGILPASMSMTQDRKLYANLIENTFRGGISNEVVGKLKDYLLPEATQVPEIVKGLQECTNEVIMTRNAVAAADRELTLLQSTYGVGKEIVLYSLRWMNEQKKKIDGSLRSHRAELKNKEETQKSYRADIPRLDTELEQAELSKKTALNNAIERLADGNSKVKNLVGTVGALEASFLVATANKKQFALGKAKWREIAEIHETRALEWVGSWLESCRKNVEREKFEQELRAEALQKECNRLNSGMAPVMSENLAAKTGGETLDKALESLSEQEAIAVELSLCGLSDGVVGIDADALENLPATDELPDTFWLGMLRPEPIELKSSGDWYFSPIRSGYVATKKEKVPVFGSEARTARRNAILVEIDTLRIKVKEADLASQRIVAKQTALTKYGESIEYFFANNDIEIEKNLQKCEADLESRKLEIAEAEKGCLALQESIKEIAKPYDEILVKLREQQTAKQRSLESINVAIIDLQHTIAEMEKASADVLEEVCSAKEILEEEFDLMFASAEELDDFNEVRLAIDQTKRISSLGVALRDETPARLMVLQEADPNNRLSTLKLWPVLMEIVRERVSIDRAEVDGEDMIQVMKEHRATLDSQLILHENEVRIRARNIFQTIGTLVTSQQRKIDKLSQLGSAIEFGNVIGIRIVLAPRREMLSVLEGFAEQLFSEKKPIDLALKDWFDAASSRQDSIPLSGEELLDYRNYVDLSIEACRKSSGWAPATSLSGGEAIGSGLAVALMLSRSIAAKGEIKVDQISPLFAVDEVQRLDGPGQAVIVNFAKRERFQVIVTAPSLSPNYSCILYALNRIFDPKERLVIRGIRVTGKDAA